MGLRRIKQQLSREDGAEMIEFLGLLPILLMVGLIIVQLLLAGQTMMVALSAAREGARAAVVCEDVGSAVARASPGFAPQISTQDGADDVKVIVGLQVPTIDIPFVHTLMPVVQESATMRKEKTTCGGF